MKRLEAKVFGLVQGVSFRYYTRREADRLNVLGWVANRPDGTVQVVAEGPDTSLRALLEFLQHGSPAARVEKVATTWLEPTGEFTRFSIRL